MSGPARSRAGWGQRVIAGWVYGGALAALALLALLPLMARGWPQPLALTVLHLPVYMLHQWEEHDGDRFRRFVNASVGGGREVLTPLASFLINVPGVWGALIATAYLAADAHPGYGLVAADLVLLNAALHVVHSLVARTWVPGVVTAVTLFVPLGWWTTVTIRAAGAAVGPYPAIGWASALALHACVLVCARATGGAWPRQWPARPPSR